RCDSFLGRHESTGLAYRRTESAWHHLTALCARSIFTTGVDPGGMGSRISTTDGPELMNQGSEKPHVVIIGAGPAGLTAAYILVERYGIRSTIIESDSVVGGISRTVERDGWRFDIGGHRFFTKVKDVESLWHEILPDEDFMLRPRMSRIYYDGKYYDY